MTSLCEEVFGADSAHHDPRGDMDSCLYALSDGRAGFVECAERETSFILGQLGGCVAHGMVTSSCSR